MIALMMGQQLAGGDEEGHELGLAGGNQLVAGRHEHWVVARADHGSHEHGRSRPRLTAADEALPFHWPDWRVHGAGPASAVIWRRSSVLISGSSAISVRATTLPTPGTEASKFSCSRQAGGRVTAQSGFAGGPSDCSGSMERRAENHAPPRACCPSRASVSPPATAPSSLHDDDAGKYKVHAWLVLSDCQSSSVGRAARCRRGASDPATAQGLRRERSGGQEREALAHSKVAGASKTPIGAVTRNFCRRRCPNWSRHLPDWLSLDCAAAGRPKRRLPSASKSGRHQSFFASSRLRRGPGNLC